MAIGRVSAAKGPPTIMPAWTISDSALAFGQSGSG
jgi:hypothetical protein